MTVGTFLLDLWRLRGCSRRFVVAERSPACCWLALPAGAFAAIAADLGAAHQAHRRGCCKFEEQFPEALALISRALKAGHTFTTGLSMVAEEMPAPIGPEFKLLYDQQNYGMPLPDALKEFARPRSAARRAVLRHRRADSARVRRQPGRGSRQHRDGHSRSLPRQAADSRRVGARPDDRLGARGVPPALAAVLFVDQPGALEDADSDRPLGIKLIIGAVVLQIIGTLIIRKMVQIEY